MNLRNTTRLLQKAAQDYNAGLYVVAYGGYCEALEIELQTQSIKAVYCEVGILQCRMMLGSLPYLSLINTVHDLSDKIKKLPSNWWVKECDQILITMRQHLGSTIFKMRYVDESAARLLEAFQTKSFDDLFATVTLKSNDEQSKFDYFHSIISALEYGIHSSQAFCQRYKKTDDIIRLKTILANLYEKVADYYMDYCANESNQFKWTLQGWDGVQPFSALREAKKLYAAAIEIRSSDEIDDKPTLELLFSPLTVAYTAHTFFKDLPKNLKFFNIQEIIQTHSLDKIVANLEDEDERAYWQGELPAKSASEKAEKKRARNDDEGAPDERAEKVARTDLQQFAVFRPLTASGEVFKADEKSSPEIIYKS